MERKSLRNILFILFFILILLLGIYFYINMRKDKLDKNHDSVMVQSPMDSAQTAAPGEAEEEAPLMEETETAAAVEEPLAPERYITGYHTVKEGESFSLITGYYWDDMFLWPDLYVRNNMKTDDPDLIYPQEIIDIYNRLGEGDNYSDVEREELLKSYLQVYRIYKALGPEKNNSTWSLLWCAAKYDHDFLEHYASWIDPKDLEMAQKYVDEEGFLE